LLGHDIGGVALAPIGRRPKGEWRNMELVIAKEADRIAHDMVDFGFIRKKCAYPAFELKKG
jgi:hypothetical protein